MVLQTTPNMIRQLVSGNKLRFQAEGFDLDLSYITDKIIAMGFPAQKLEGVYRNHIDDVFKFLEHKHKHRYKLYNLCSERHYDAERFHGRVASYPFDDHNPPKIEDMNRFCEDVASWLRQDDKNVVAIHCKAGKGRTGVMICAFLIHAGYVQTAADALLEYGSKRTSDAKGVTIPSQRRYVEYYEKLVTRQIRYEPVTLLPDCISFSPLPCLNNGTPSFFFVMYGQEKKELFRSEPKKAGKNCFEYIFHCNAPAIAGDVKIEFKNSNVLNVRQNTLFSFWFNTFFVLNHSSGQSSPATKVPFLPATATTPASDHLTSRNRGETFLIQQPFGSASNLRPTARNGSGVFPQDVACAGTQRELCQKSDHHNNHHDDEDAGVTLVLTREQLDRVHKVKHSKVFPSDFRVEMRFKSSSEASARAAGLNHDHSDLRAASPAAHSGCGAPRGNGTYPHLPDGSSESDPSTDGEEGWDVACTFATEN